MTKKPAATLTPADAREILERALWFSNQGEFAVPTVDLHRKPWDRTPTEEHHRAAQSAMLRAAARLAAYSGDVTLLPLVIQAYEAHGTAEDHHLDRDGVIEPFADAIEWLLQLGATVDADVRALAKSDDYAIRLALVTGLRDAAAEFEQLLRSLANDANAQVRSAAKEALAAIGAPAWWVGVFAVDPALALSEEEAARFGPQIARYTEIVNMPYGAYAVRDELLDIIDQLPDVLARDACLRWVQSDRWLDREGRLAARMARIPGTLKDVVAAVVADDSYQLSEFTRHWSPAYVGDREGGAREIHAMVAGRDPAERRSTSSVTWTLCSMAGDLWPPEADATDLVEEVLANAVEIDDDAYWLDAVDHWVDEAASSSPVTIASVGARLVAAFLDGDPRRECKRLHRLTDKALSALPLEARREAARRAIGSANDDVAKWGLGQLLGASHDPERDPPVDELFEQLGADPRLRRSLARDMDKSKRFRAQVLGWIHGGQVDLETASMAIMNLAHTFQTVRDEYLTGHEDMDRYRRTDEGPPLTDEDFDALQRLRDASAAEPNHLTLLATRNRPLSPEDRAYAERALALWRAGNKDVSEALAAVYGSGGTAEDVRTVEQIAARDEDDDDTFLGIVDRMKTRLGLIPPRRRGTAQREAPSEDDDELEWMDEDD